MERKAGLASITGGSLTGVLGSENPSSSSMVIGLSTDPSSQGKRKSSNGWATRIRKVQNSKYETDLLKIVDCFIDGFGTVNLISIFLLIIKNFLIKILSKLFLFKSKVFSQDANFGLIFSTRLQKFNLTFLQDAKTVLIFLTSAKIFNKFLC